MGRGWRREGGERDICLSSFDARLVSISPSFSPSFFASFAPPSSSVLRADLSSSSFISLPSPLLPPGSKKVNPSARFHGLFCVARGMDPGKIARVTPPVVRKEKKVNGKVGYFRRRATLILYMRKEEKRRSRGLIVDCLARELFGYYYYPFLSRLDRFLFFASIVQRFPSDSVAARPVLSGRARTIIRGG